MWLWFLLVLNSLQAGRHVCCAKAECTGLEKFVRPKRLWTTLPMVLTSLETRYLR